MDARRFVNQVKTMIPDFTWEHFLELLEMMPNAEDELEKYRKLRDLYRRGQEMEALYQQGLAADVSSGISDAVVQPPRHFIGPGMIPVLPGYTAAVMRTAIFNEPPGELPMVAENNYDRLGSDEDGWRSQHYALYVNDYSFETSMDGYFITDAQVIAVCEILSFKFDGCLGLDRRCRRRRRCHRWALCRNGICYIRRQHRNMIRHICLQGYMPHPRFIQQCFRTSMGGYFITDAQVIAVCEILSFKFDTYKVYDGRDYVELTRRLIENGSAHYGGGISHSTIMVCHGRANEFSPLNGL